MKRILTGLILLMLAFSLSVCQAMNPEEYIASIAPYAVRVKDYGLFPSVAIAQSCRETGFGRSLDDLDIRGTPIRQFNNILGKKWVHGQHYEKQTPEGSGNSRILVVRKFQVYKSLEECFLDYANNINRNPAYKYRDTSSAHAFIHSIAPRYATDNPKAYASGVLRIIDQYNLTRYDRD